MTPLYFVAWTWLCFIEPYYGLAVAGAYGMYLLLRKRPSTLNID